MDHFQHPRKTKSGKSVILLWNEIKEAKQMHLRAKLADDFVKMREADILIEALNEDLGLKI